jgi:hypothetical protein
METRLGFGVFRGSVGGVAVGLGRGSGFRCGGFRFGGGDGLEVVAR